MVPTSCPGVAVTRGNPLAETLGQLVSVRIVPAAREAGGIQANPSFEAVVEHDLEFAHRDEIAVRALVGLVEGGRPVEEVGRPVRSRSCNAAKIPTSRNIEPPPSLPTRFSGGDGGPDAGTSCSSATESARWLMSCPASRARGPS